MRAKTPTHEQFDLSEFSVEEPTEPDALPSMQDLMAEIGCVPVPTSERPTKPIRPLVRWGEGKAP